MTIVNMAARMMKADSCAVILLTVKTFADKLFASVLGLMFLVNKLIF